MIGGIIVGNTFYMAEPEASGEGIPSYIRAVNYKYGFLSPMATLFKYLAAHTLHPPFIRQDEAKGLIDALDLSLIHI